MPDDLDRGDLARACADRLMGTIPRQECVVFFESQIKELLEARRNPENSLFFTAIDQRIEFTRKFVGRLTNAQAK